MTIYYNLMWWIFFLDTLDESTDTLKEFAIGGICNFCLDPRVAKSIQENNGIPLIIDCLSANNTETVLSAITTLTLLVISSNKKEIATAAVKECMQRYKQSNNPRLKNSATLFLQTVDSL